MDEKNDLYMTVRIRAEKHWHIGKALIKMQEQLDKTDTEFEIIQIYYEQEENTNTPQDLH